ncbi:adenylate/guanylate cyclase domain-containing protein [Oscillatoria sp. FACHB-1406]|uniref:adenylate/guanylate cyclase domain-containing protein n=1 Tax=Oscillatoria sp. FACHB-1406 TaxID=2692846 RepID=UPI0016834022|nr:adenylate/guanylate cyclase domain-containing protein [Oscillatoria sp. FACHB-1406]MBD2577094.1 PAS domain S-box protein [Oscillatoria sp. FACHB-1406]
MHEAIEELLSARGIEYVLLDPELRVVRTSARACSFVESPELLRAGEDIRSGFPELFGAEDCLEAIVRGESERFEIRAIARSLGTFHEPSVQGTVAYLDLQIVCLRAHCESPPKLLATLENVSDRMNLEQTLVQSTNEMSLMMASLEASHEYIHKVIESIADALFVVRADGIIKTVNRSALEWFGYARSESIGQPITRIITDERFVFEELHQSLTTRSESIRELEMHCSTKTGKQLLVAFSCSSIAADPHSGSEFLYIGRDITATRQAQRRVAAQYRVAQILSTSASVELALQPILETLCENLDWLTGEMWLVESEISLDLKPVATWQKPSEEVRTWQLQAQTNTERENLARYAWQSGQPQWCILSILDGGSQEMPLNARAASRSPAGSQHSLMLAIPIKSGQDKYGVMLFLNSEAKSPDENLLQILDTIGTNLAQFFQRKRAEAALAESEERYRDLFENASDLIWSFDVRGRFLYANRACQQALGYSWQELKQRSMFDLLPLGQRIEFAKNFRRALYGERIEQMRTTLLTIANRRIEIEGSISSKQGKGEEIAIQAMFRDITQRLATELALRDQQQRAERLLLNILPAKIAAKLKLNDRTIAEKFDRATVLFADIVGFTGIAGELSPLELVNLLNDIFSQFDRLTELHKLEKIKTIGDAYMLVSGIPEHHPNNIAAVADFALDVQDAIAQFNGDRNFNLSIRVGIHTGPVVAGVIGLKKFIYDLWGDTVNIASRMESHGVPGRIQVTQAVRDSLRSHYKFEYRGQIPIKGKGKMDTYWLVGKL